jgi:ABC-type transport system substrate-binding protein
LLARARNLPLARQQATAPGATADRRQGHQADEDGLSWTLTLRDGLRFHDKEPVLTRDVVAR